MHKLSHRIISLVIGLLLSVAVLPVPVAAAQSGSCGEGLTWQLSGGTLRISGKGEMQSFTDETMPPWYPQAASITTVSITEGVTSVGDRAFFGCTSITNVRLPSTVVSIGAFSFKNCSSLEYVYLPANLTAIGESAFENCINLKGITLPNGLQSIGSFAFYRCTALTTISIPVSLIRLGTVVFAYCTGLVRAEIHSRLTALPDWTFYGCTSLTEVSLPQTVTVTGEDSFRDCKNLQAIYYDGTADVTPPQGSGTDTEVRPTGEMPSSGSNSRWDIPGNSAESTTVTDTGNSNLTEKTTTDLDIKINGKDSTLEDVSAAGEEDEISIGSSTTTVISGTVSNSEGWNELGEKVDNAKKNDETVVKVDVKLSGSTVSGKDLSNIAEKDVDTTITTASGSTWQLEQGSNTKKDFSQKEYDLDYTVSDAEGKEKPDIESDKLYQIDFAGSTDFNATVGIQIPDAKRQYASLYQDKELIQTTIVDDDGMAWFSLANVDAKTNYYIGVNARGIDPHQAVIPDSLSKTYGADYTLTDSTGKGYQVTGRSSRWGITGGRFATYVGIAVALVVLIVALVMITLNKLAKNKAKYATPQGEDDAIDEDALRLQVMQEMLEETRQSNNKKE